MRFCSTFSGKEKHFLFVSIQLSCRIVMIPQLALDLCPPPCRAAGRVSSLGSQGDCGSTKPHSQLPSHQQALATYSSSILKSFSSTQSLPHSLIPPGGKPSPTVTGDRSLLSRKGFDFCRRINSKLIICERKTQRERERGTITRVLPFLSCHPGF